MKISIITVAYNSASTIRDAVESVLNQTYTDIEYIVIDGLSQDGTVEIVKEYDSLFDGRLRLICEKDSGLYDAMNKGFRMATGDVIGIINSDDLFSDSQAIEKVMECFRANDPVDGVFADLLYVAQNDVNKIIRRWRTGKQRPFSLGWHPAHPTFYVKKEIYDRCGLFDLNFKLAADFELMLRLVEKEHISMVYLPEPLVKMRLGGVTNKNLRNIRKGNMECLNAFKKNAIEVSPLYPFFRLLPKLMQYL